MKRNQALFITLDALETGQQADKVAPAVSSFLRDQNSRGLKLIVVTDRLEFLGKRYRTNGDLLAALRNSERHLLPISDVICLDNAFDPTPFWYIARRFDIDLELSHLVALAGEHSGAAKNAGLEQHQACSQACGTAA